MVLLCKLIWVQVRGCVCQKAVEDNTFKAFHCDRSQSNGTIIMKWSRFAVLGHSCLHVQREASKCYFDVLQNIFHGAMSLDQLCLARPTPLMANYRSPVAGLYLCGSGAHPGIVFSFIFMFLNLNSDIIYFLKAYSPVNCTGLPQGFSWVQTLHKSTNKH